MTQEIQPTSKRIRLVDKEDYGVDLEYNDDFVILHLPWTYKFSKSIYQDMLATMDNLEDFLNCMGYSRIHLGIEPGRTSTLKLAKRLGFNQIGHHSGHDIYEKIIGE